MSLASLFRRYATDNLCAIVNCLLCMESSLLPGESLVNDLGLFVDAEIGESVGVVFHERRGTKRPLCGTERAEGYTSSQEWHCWKNGEDR